MLDMWDHIAEDSPDQADRWVDKLDEKFKLIATQPLMGRARHELAANLRSFPFGRYVIFYAPIEGGIDVVRVLHSARDVDTAFGDELCRNDEERLLLLGALLEHVGTARAVQLGPLQAWQNAVAMRIEDNS